MINILGKINYPNLRFVIVEDNVVDLFLKCLNSDDSGEYWEQWHRMTLANNATEADIHEAIYKVVRVMVSHEVDEHFKIDGVQLHPPHPPGWQRPDWAPQP